MRVIKLEKEGGILIPVNTGRIISIELPKKRGTKAVIKIIFACFFFRGSWLFLP
jgi:hypothetical protein